MRIFGKNSRMGDSGGRAGLGKSMILFCFVLFYMLSLRCL